MRMDHSNISRRGFLQVAAGAAAGASCSGVAPQVEWRNRQSSMAYRRLGRTNCMVSEIVFGGTQPLAENPRYLEIALGRGLNYLDTAAAYGRGEGERRLGQFVRQSSIREKVFISSKVSFLDDTRNEKTQAVYEQLTAEQQAEIEREVEQYMNVEGLINPDYTIDYYPPRSYAELIRLACRSDVVIRRHPEKVRASINFADYIVQCVEQSLNQLQTDYLDVLHCPHGVSTPGEMELEDVREAFERLKKAGKVRFAGASAHSDPAGMVKTAARLGFYDVVMPAFNYVNHRYFKEAFTAAKKADLGVIAMKAARPLNADYAPTKFQEAFTGIQRAIPGVTNPAVMGYLWVLQQPVVAAVNSNMISEEMVTENLAIVGKKIELPAEQMMNLGD